MPYLLAVLVLLLVIAASSLAAILREALGLSLAWQVAIFDFLLIAAGSVLLTRFRWWRSSGFLSWITARDAILFLPVVAIALLSLSEGIAVTGPGQVLRFAVLSLVVGIAEEMIFRGLILDALLPAGITTAVAGSALLFGLPHLLNALGGTWDPVFTLADTIAAVGIGIVFAALRIRTGSIWPLIGLHALIDMSALLATGSLVVGAQSALSLATTVFAGIFLVAYGLLLVRSAGRNGAGIPPAP